MNLEPKSILPKAMKPVAGTCKARPGIMGPEKVFRPLPNRLTQAVGPIVFLDHFPKSVREPKTPSLPSGTSAHPHRGIATLTYPISGDLLHLDSSGGFGIVRAGGVQWMNAGTGVIHDEQLSIEFQKAGGTVYSFQFWINLPARRKAEPPAYMPVESEELPLIELPDGAGTVKVLAGRLMGEMSRVPTYTEQFVYHVQLGRGKHAHLPTEADLEYAGYLPSGSARIAGVPIEARQFFLFGTEGSSIEIANDFKSAVDILIFGGEPYTEPVVSHGPFVMNTKEEITRAYADYREGKYGRIDYGVLNAN